MIELNLEPDPSGTKFVSRASVKPLSPEQQRIAANPSSPWLAAFQLKQRKRQETLRTEKALEKRDKDAAFAARASAVV